MLTLVAHLLRGDVAVLLQIELDGDDRDALRGDGDQLVDAADGVDRLLDLVGDLGLDLLGRRRPPGRVVMVTKGKSTLGKRSTPSWK